MEQSLPQKCSTSRGGESEEEEEGYDPIIPTWRAVGGLYLSCEVHGASDLGASVSNMRGSHAVGWKMADVPRGGDPFWQEGADRELPESDPGDKLL